MSSKRSRLEIIYDLLNAMQQKGGMIKPTHLLYKSNLSHKKMKEYVTELMKQEFVEAKEKKGKKHFKITEKGSEFLGEFKRIKQFSESFGI
jgi:predicted transcriptional regulator